MMLNFSRLTLLTSAFLIITACNSSGSSDSNSSSSGSSGTDTVGGSETVSTRAFTAKLIETDVSGNTHTVINYNVNAQGIITTINTQMLDGRTENYTTIITLDNNSRLLQIVDNEFRQDDGTDTVINCGYETNSNNKVTKQTCTTDSGFSAGDVDSEEYFYNNAGDIAYTRVTDPTSTSDYALSYNSSSQLANAVSGNYDKNTDAFSPNSPAYVLTYTANGYLNSIATFTSGVSTPFESAAITRDSDGRIIKIESSSSSNFIMEDMVYTDSKLSYKVTENSSGTPKVTIGAIEYSDANSNLDSIFLRLFDLYGVAFDSIDLFIPRTDSNYPELHVR